MRPRNTSPLGVASRVVLLWVAYALRVLGLQAQGLWRDEVDQWRFAFLPLRDLLLNFTRPGWNGPLYSPLLRGWIVLTGESVYAMRMLSVVWGMLALAVTVVLARRLLGRQAAAITAVLLTFSPYLIWYAQEIKMYTWVPLLTALALYALLRACERPRAVRWVAVWGATTLAIYSHILAALLIPVLALWFLLYPRRQRRAWAGGLAVLAGLTLPYLPLLRWQSALALMPRETGFPHRTLGQMIATLLESWSAGVYQGPWHVAGALVAFKLCFGILAVVGIAGTIARAFSRAEPWTRAARTLRREAETALPDRAVDSAYLMRLSGQLTVSAQRRVVAHLARLTMVLVWLGVPLALVWGVSLRGPIFTDRYLIWTAPAFYLLVAEGVAVLQRGASVLGSQLSVVRSWTGRLAYAALVPLLVISTHAVYAQATYPFKPQFEPATAAIAAGREEGDLLLFQIPYNHHVVGYYAGYPSLDPWAEAPYTNWSGENGGYLIGAAEVARSMRGLVAGYDRVWLVYSEVSAWDDRELVKAWLDSEYVLLRTEDFHGVSLYLYTRPQRS